MTWETVIGLEVHAQLKTQSKLFSGSATQFGMQPNTQTSFIDAGLPGVLPVLNQEAVIKAIQFGLAIQATIHDLSYFERKNYFYPDLPKGYQISQYQRPIVEHGTLAVLLPSHQTKIITIARAHLEEDAGKSIHDAHATYTGVDLNRAGIPLLEIVTTPCMSSAEEAVAYLKTLQQLLRFLDVCDGNMQEGSFRCDVNLSLRPYGSQTLGTRTELKNLNSFRFIEKAILFEQARHKACLETGESLSQETRLYCPDTNTTHVMRTKENENDYRYFPDPDLLPIKISKDLMQRVAATMPESPQTITSRLHASDQLNDDDIEFLMSSPALIRYYDAVKEQTVAPVHLIVNWLRGAYSAVMNEHAMTFEHPPVSAVQLGTLLTRLSEERISAKVAKHIFQKLVNTTADIDTIIQNEGYAHPQDTQQLDELVKTLIEQYPQQATELRSGKDKLMAFFVGQIMKQTKGQASPEQVNALIKKHLGL